MPYITDIYAREVLDSRGNPTVEVEVTTENGSMGRAIVPSGASTGAAEALELRDNNEKRYHGKGVLKAVSNVNNIISPELIGYDVREQLTIDEKLIALDGTQNKSKLGANAILGVSLACARCAAVYSNIPLYRYFGGFYGCTLPTPMMNILNGGAHANWCIDFQEIMIVPVGAKNFKEALRMSSEVFHTLKVVLNDAGYATSVGDEGGYAPMLNSNEQALEIVCLAITKAGYTLKKDFYLALDIASSEFYNPSTKQYRIKSLVPANDENNTKGSFEYKFLHADDMIAYLDELIKKYPIISIEDALDENDWDGWKKLTKRLGNKVQLVGDDLFTTNTVRLNRGIKNNIANSILIKINQIGTLSETFAAVEMAKNAGYTAVISHRSGETEDTTIADIAVGLNTGQIKTGSLSRTDRIAKYNQLLRIEEELGTSAKYLGIDAFRK